MIVIGWLMQLAQFAFLKADAEKANGYLSKLIEFHPDNLVATEMLSNSLMKLGKIEESKSLGAKIMRDVTEVPEAGTMSIIVDPTGAMLALWKSRPRETA